jgi:GDP-L-fucose synthase
MPEDLGRCLVTGGSGFLGSAVLTELRRRGHDQVVAPSHQDCGLVRQEATEDLFARLRPDTVLHLAARVGGIGANQANPGLFFYANAMMGINVVEACRRVGVRRLVVAGTTCAYPRVVPIPFREETLWDGYPEATNAPYGVAKRALLTMLQAYRTQYGLSGVYLLPANLYGPGDNFDLESGHVIPAMIRRFCQARDAGAGAVTLWGSGLPTREFLYVDDCARALVLAAERYDSPEPLNVGTGAEVSIADLAALVRRTLGYSGVVQWDTARPDGQPRRRLDTRRAEAALGFVATTTLEEGLRRTCQWFDRKRVHP